MVSFVLILSLIGTNLFAQSNPDYNETACQKLGMFEAICAEKVFNFKLDEKKENPHDIMEPKKVKTLLSFACPDLYKNYYSTACKDAGIIDIDFCMGILREQAFKCDERIKKDIKKIFNANPDRKGLQARKYFISKCGNIEQNINIYSKELQKRTTMTSEDVKKWTDTTLACREEKRLEKEKQNKKEPRKINGDPTSVGKCIQRRVLRPGSEWDARDGFDIFLPSGKYLCHIHAKYEGRPWEASYCKNQTMVCKPDEEPVVIAELEKFKECQWVEYQQWKGQLGCKENEVVCMGKIVCPVKDKDPEFRNIVCKGEDGACPSAAQCASDNRFSKEGDGFSDGKYKTQKVQEQ